MSKLFTHANVHRLLVLVICNMATTIQGFLNVGRFQWHALVTGSLAAGASAALGWFIGQMSSPDDSAPAPAPLMPVRNDTRTSSSAIQLPPITVAPINPNDPRPH